MRKFYNSIIFCLAAALPLLVASCSHSDPRTQALIDLAVSMMRVLAVGYICVSVTQVLGGVMRGAGDTMTPMWISLITTVAVRVPIAYGISFLTRTAELPYGQKECIQISIP